MSAEFAQACDFKFATLQWYSGAGKKKPTWFENDGRAERPGLKGLAVPALNSNCLPLIKSP